MGRSDLEHLVAQFNQTYAGTTDSHGRAIPQLALPASYSFGDNLNYAQLNLLWEGWLRLRTNVASEAIVDRFTKRDLGFYQEKLRECLTEFRRILKPARFPQRR